MGLPDTNAEGYKNGSPITFASGLKGKLLIIHGTGDDNVHFQGTQRLINKLKAWRGIATRCDKSPDSYLAGLHLRAAMIWVDDLIKTTE